MYTEREREQIDTLVIGGGQAGLSVGYHLARRGLPFLIVDAADRIGDTWRGRWDSLRLFTPARFDGLDGMPFPAHPDTFPTKDQMADYLEAYAARHELPVRSGVRIERLTHAAGKFVADAGRRRYEADNVVVAMASYQAPRLPGFAAELDPGIRQLHSAHYRNPDQLADGPVLLVGAGNSGSEIAMELAGRHRVLMSGRNVGQIPFRIGGLAARLVMARLVLRVLFHRVFTVRTPIGRKVRRKVLSEGGPLIRVKDVDLDRAGVERAPRTTGVVDGRPLLEDGRVLDVANVIWCTGFGTGLDWIDLPIFEGDEPGHRSGVVPGYPGLYFVGRQFLHAYSSTMVHGVGRDADRIAGVIAKRAAGAAPTDARSATGAAA